MKTVPAVVSLVLASLAIAPVRAAAPAPAASSVRVQLTFADSPARNLHRVYFHTADEVTYAHASDSESPPNEIIMGNFPPEYPRTMFDLRKFATAHHIPVTLIPGPAAVATDGVETVANDEHNELFSRLKPVSDMGERVTLATTLGYTLRVRPDFSDSSTVQVSLALDETAFVPAAEGGRDADAIVHRTFSGNNQFVSGETRLLGAWDKGDGMTHLVYATVTLLPSAKS